MSDEAREVAQSSTAPARFEPDSRMVESGRSIAPELYNLILPVGYAGDGSVNRAFNLEGLYVNEAGGFSARVLRVIEGSIGDLFSYRISKEDEEEVVGAVGKEYPPAVNEPDFRLTTAQVLVATLRAANGLLGPKVIEKVVADTADTGLEMRGDEKLRQSWASYFTGVVNGAAERLVNGLDVEGERRRVEELRGLVGEAEKKGEKKQVEDIIQRISHGVELREETAERLRQFGGEVWRGTNI
ncbi:hypothetical protein A3H89_00355 [Candidatus Amesbacteria bacterium RIFCSPLOWO2_02_FULL_48_11]|uniref:Uncharacterized protein n=3 Tax=Candidatus Amesiibacteriota TaxID=1752730 RepID=A0A0G1WTT8_9BACT|nr:MAG: hypothetical protein UX78_C0005G0069 [Candidatus Amesbacteria bacterium GW2011_GWA2_47_11]KKU93753.1 MAG: hypothetical protein UY22_C0017G0010 [Candidatus Amesbacteria bacterium GW2011_GWC1_48_10]KKU99547.1 MAG: hypothetical protein UY33_C0028G0001 [Candidatus Amesbacteria bacterium GW2011_GWA1_48_9]OGC89999.1 MAG: hypothetical protein A2V48_01160 [Candidatus Amesbacteria bacterium RBG_19FT_COMBO_48_16]OGC96206.1 MAG: hypothetical protein A3C34_02370 [Candidatus Amesbacteria bacterium R